MQIKFSDHEMKNPIKIWEEPMIDKYRLKRKEKK